MAVSLRAADARKGVSAWCLAPPWGTIFAVTKQKFAEQRVAFFFHPAPRPSMMRAGGLLKHENHYLSI